VNGRCRGLLRNALLREYRTGQLVWPSPPHCAPTGPRCSRHCHPRRGLFCSCRSACPVLAGRKFTLEKLNGVRFLEADLNHCLLLYREELFHSYAILVIGGYGSIGYCLVLQQMGQYTDPRLTNLDLPTNAGNPNNVNECGKPVPEEYVRLRQWSVEATNGYYCGEGLSHEHFAQQHFKRHNRNVS